MLQPSIEFEALRSRPLRARGLKLANHTASLYSVRSRPLRARGLKQEWGNQSVNLRKSRPLRARGLKQAFQKNDYLAKGRRAPCGRVD